MHSFVVLASGQTATVIHSRFDILYAAGQRPGTIGWDNELCGHEGWLNLTLTDDEGIMSVRPSAIEAVINYTEVQL